MAGKQLLFSVTAKDCEWSYTRGTGPGGQKRNKTSSAVHCFHPPSKARSYSDETRSQHENKRLAFVKMVNTPEFQRWHKLEIMRRIGTLKEIEEIVEKELIHNTKVEYRVDGVWTEERDT